MLRALLLALLTVIAADAAAQGTGARPAPTSRLPFGLQNASEYELCLEQARREPGKALEAAQAWRVRGGGDAAQHCIAIALLVGGEAKLAAEQLDRLAQAMRARPPALRAEVLAQAARAWLLAEDPERAHAAATRALEINPGSVELWIDRAEIHAATRRFWEAIDDLNRAIEIDPRRADALVFRAASYRRVDAAELAREDVERALALAPKLAEAWLERGILNRARGDIAAARHDLLQVLLIDPDGPVGDSAREQIERMELKLDAPAGKP